VAAEGRKQPQTPGREAAAEGRKCPRTPGRTVVVAQREGTAMAAMEEGAGVGGEPLITTTVGLWSQEFTYCRSSTNVSMRLEACTQFA
jgi:hypothetical protein